MIRRPNWQVVARTGDRLGEGILWEPRQRALWWVDFYGPTLHRLRDGDLRSWTLPGAAAVGSLAFADDGRLILALDHRIVMFDPAGGTVEAFGNPKADAAHLAYNDAKVDRAGAYWVGTYDLSETEPRAVLYRLSQAQGEAMLGGFPVCNGPAFSPDNRTLYFSDTGGRRVFAFPHDPQTGRLGPRRLLAAFPEAEGIPDGLAVDAAGDIWVAQYGAGLVTRLTPQGAIAERLAAPVPNVSSCCLGGPDLRTLFIASGWGDGVTVAGEGGDPGGSVFSCRVAGPGLPEPSHRLQRT